MTTIQNYMQYHIMTGGASRVLSVEQRKRNKSHSGKHLNGGEGVQRGQIVQTTK